MFPDQVHNAPPIIALLNVLHRQVREFRATQSAPEDAEFRGKRSLISRESDHCFQTKTISVFSESDHCFHGKPITRSA